MFLQSTGTPYFDAHSSLKVFANLHPSVLFTSTMLSSQKLYRIKNSIGYAILAVGVVGVAVVVQLTISFL